MPFEKQTKEIANPLDTDSSKNSILELEPSIFKFDKPLASQTNELQHRPSLPEFFITDQSGSPDLVDEFESEYDEQRANKILVELLDSADGDKQAIGKRFRSLLEHPQQQYVIKAALSIVSDDSTTKALKKLADAVDRLCQRENIGVLSVLKEMFSKESANAASGKAVKTLISMLAEGGDPAAVAAKWLAKLTDSLDGAANRCILERIQLSDKPDAALCSWQKIFDNPDQKEDAALLKELLTSLEPREHRAALKLMELIPLIAPRDTTAIRKMFANQTSRKEAINILELDLGADQVATLIQMSQSKPDRKAFDKLISAKGIDRLDSAEVLGFLCGSENERRTGTALVGLLNADLDAFLVVRNIGQQRHIDEFASLLNSSKHSKGAIEILRMMERGSRTEGVDTIVEMLTDLRYKPLALELVKMLGTDEGKNDAAAIIKHAYDREKIHLLMDIHSSNKPVFDVLLQGLRDVAKRGAAMKLLNVGAEYAQSRGITVSATGQVISDEPKYGGSDGFREVIANKDKVATAMKLSGSNLTSSELMTFFHMQEQLGKKGRDYQDGLTILQEMAGSQEDYEDVRLILAGDTGVAKSIVQMLGSENKDDRGITRLLLATKDIATVSSLHDMLKHDKATARRLDSLPDHGISILRELKEPNLVKSFLEVLDRPGQDKELLLEWVKQGGGCLYRLMQWHTGRNVVRMSEGKKARELSDHVFQLIKNRNDLQTDPSRGWHEKRDEYRKAKEDLETVMRVVSTNWEDGPYSRSHFEMAPELNKLLSQESTRAAGMILLEAIELGDDGGYNTLAEHSAKELLLMLTSKQPAAAKSAERILGWLNKHPEHKDNILSNLSDELLGVLGDLLESAPSAAREIIKRLRDDPAPLIPNSRQLLRMLADSDQQTVEAAKQVIKWFSGDDDEKRLAASVLDNVRADNMVHFVRTVNGFQVNPWQSNKTSDQSKAVGREIRKLMSSKDPEDRLAATNFMSLGLGNVVKRKLETLLAGKPQERQVARTLLLTLTYDPLERVVSLPDAQQKAVLALLNSTNPLEVRGIVKFLDLASYEFARPFKELLEDLVSPKKKVSSRAIEILRGSEAALKQRVTLNATADGKNILDRLEKMLEGSRKEEAEFLLKGSLSPEDIKVFLDEVNPVAKASLMRMNSADESALRFNPLAALSGTNEKVRAASLSLLRLLSLVGSAHDPDEKNEQTARDLAVKYAKDVDVMSFVAGLLAEESTRTAGTAIFESALSAASIRHLQVKLSSDKKQDLNEARRLFACLGHPSQVHRASAIRQLTLESEKAALAEAAERARLSRSVEEKRRISQNTGEEIATSGAKDPKKTEQGDPNATSTDTTSNIAEIADTALTIVSPTYALAKLIFGKKRK